MSAISPATGWRAAPGADYRCQCGSLLARLVPGGVELKCRRCKRTHLLPLADFEASGRSAGRAAQARGRLRSEDLE